MKRDYDIVVVGAGLAGLTMAALLASGAHADRIRITLVDAAKRPAARRSTDIDLRVSAIAPGSCDVLQRIDAWPGLEAGRVCPFDHMRVWDADDEPDSPTALCFDADEFAVPHLGYIVENLSLRQAILAVLERHRVEMSFAAGVTGLEESDDRRLLTLGDGTSLVADLVIAADGARSVIRSLAGIDVTRHAYEQTALVTHVQPERGHESTAWQRFLRDGPIGLLPLADGRASVVWSTRIETAREALLLSEAKLGLRLTDVSGGVLGELRVSGPRGGFPLVAQHANAYVRQGVALIGDAAHCVHPLAGQGANLGLADAELLAEVIHAAIDRGEHPADRPVLRRFERARRGENLRMMHFMTGLNRLFASDSSVLGELRKSGMALFNRSGPIRQRVVKVALGGGKR